MKNLKLCIQAAIEAAAEILKIYNSKDFEIKLKSDDSPLTSADIASHNLISSLLKKTKIPVLSEEGNSISYETRKKWDRLWLIDPIDGTKEFINRNGEFTVNIALIENNKTTMGVIFAPVTKELYFSKYKLGSFKSFVNLYNYNIDNIIMNAKKLPLALSNSDYTVVASRSHLSTETKEYINELKLKHKKVKIISRGSSLKLCYPRFAPTMEWDTAAGQAICENAGLKLIDLKTNKQMLYNRKQLKNNWFIVKR